MAVEKEIQFGLNVNRSLADIVSNTKALANLGVNIQDLDVIRNAAGDLGITASDIKSLSGLNVPLPEYLTRLYNDTQQYSNIINQTAGTTETLKGNLTINGVLGAGAIKYKYIDDDNTTMKVADISTSRVSSWSSPENPSNASSPIFYGSQVEVDGKVIAPNLELTTPADTVRFRFSEVPTHKIQAIIGGQTVYLYAMKGIPLIFEGFFRNLDSDVRLQNSGAVSWRIVNIQTSYLTREYENVGGSSTTRSFLRYRDTRAAQKNIEIYHNPNNITQLPLAAVGIEKLPAASLENLNNLYLDRNVIKTFPDFNQFCPNIRLLDVRENPFDLGEDPDLRKFNQNVLERIPTSVTELRMGNTFYGSITAQMRPGNNEERTSDEIKVDRTYEITNNVDFDFTTLGADNNNIGTAFKATSTTETSATFARVEDITPGLPNLITLNLNSHSRGGARAYFDRDGDDPTGSLPECSDTVQNYYAYRHSFDSIPQAVKDLPNLRQINLYANSIIDNTFSIASDNINYINIGSNSGINVPNVTNKSSLQNFYSHYNRGNSLGGDEGMFVTRNGAYKFGGCGSLLRIYCYASAYYGPIPKFAGNSSLYQVEARYSRIMGGKLINADEMVDGQSYTIWYNPDSNDDGITDEDFTAVGATSNSKYTTFTYNSAGGSISDAPKVVDREYVLHPDIFDDCANSIRYFRISSSNLINAPMHPDVFEKTTGMVGLEVRSFNRGVSGNLPSFSSMTNLRYIVMLQNNLTGPLPNLFNNPRVYYTHFYGNSFSGNIPIVESPSLAYAYWHANQLTGFNGLNCPNMRRLFISYNQITGQFPDVSNMEKMYDLYVNNNNFTDYKEGAIVGCRALNRFDISNNPNLPVGAVNQIVADLVANYENNPRGSVSVNLRNTATPTGEAVEQIEFLRAKGWNMRL
jgi:Leucine-rich repeat (LRR) protein